MFASASPQSPQAMVVHRPTPLKNDGVKVRDDDIPNINGNLKAMFQTTNQYIIISIYIYIYIIYIIVYHSIHNAISYKYAAPSSSCETHWKWWCFAHLSHRLVEISTKRYCTYFQ